MGAVLTLAMILWVFNALNLFGAAIALGIAGIFMDSDALSRLWNRHGVGLSLVAICLALFVVRYLGLKRIQSPDDKNGG